MSASTSSGKGKLLAGAFASTVMHSYLEDVHAASYPHAPSEVGGETYRFFKERYEALLQETDRDVAADLALRAIRDYMQDESLSGTFARQSSSSMNMAYFHFSSRVPIIDRIEAGESPRDILNELNGPDNSGPPPHLA